MLPRRRGGQEPFLPLFVRDGGQYHVKHMKISFPDHLVRHSGFFQNVTRDGPAQHGPPVVAATGQNFAAVLFGGDGIKKDFHPFAKPRGIVVHHRLRVAKGFQDGVGQHHFVFNGGGFPTAVVHDGTARVASLSRVVAPHQRRQKIQDLFGGFSLARPRFPTDQHGLPFPRGAHAQEGTRRHAKHMRFTLVQRIFHQVLFVVLHHFGAVNRFAVFSGQQLVGVDRNDNVGDVRVNEIVEEPLTNLMQDGRFGKVFQRF